MLLGIVSRFAPFLRRWAGGAVWDIESMLVEIFEHTDELGAGNIDSEFLT